MRFFLFCLGIIEEKKRYLKEIEGNLNKEIFERN